MVICLCSWHVLYARDYYQEHAVGWHWYDDPKETEQKEQKKSEEKKRDADPIAQMSTVKKTIQRALDHAILEPTPQNIQSYIALQNQLNTRSEQFADTWQQVLSQHPELNYSLSHPTNNVPGKPVYSSFIVAPVLIVNVLHLFLKPLQHGMGLRLLA
jgi:conjugal transfer pilus assembly protein TraF